MGAVGRRPLPTLIIGIGNPSRGDDALGPLLIEQLEALNLPNVELLTDFQLQVEYALDLNGREKVIFVDATVSGDDAYRFEGIQPNPDNSFSSHALSPQAVLHAAQQLFGITPPAWILMIRGYRFELGEELSSTASENLAASIKFLVDRLRGT